MVAKEKMNPIAQPVPELPVVDVERAQQHYRDALGFEIAWLYPGKEIGAVSRGEVAIFFRKRRPPFEPAVHWVFAGLRANKSVTFTPHTIHYIATSYDDEGKSEVSSLVRTVNANGDWHHVQTMSDGTIREGHGHMSRLPNIDQSNPRADILGHAVIVQTVRNQDSTLEQSYCPELQDDLRHVLRANDGRLILKMEAVAID